MARGLTTGTDDRYRWVALSNTTLAVFMSQLDGSIVLIALPAIFRGIHLDPLAAGNVAYLLWLIMGYRLVQAVLVVTVGRFGDMFGRVRTYPTASRIKSAPCRRCRRCSRQSSASTRWRTCWRRVARCPRFRLALNRPSPAGSSSRT
jgi:hypothetical protein